MGDAVLSRFLILIADALCSSVDQAHDSMMNIDVNRVGQKVECVISPAGGRRLGEASLLNRSYVLQILVPKEIVKGPPVSKKWSTNSCGS